jgi:plastocyanin
MRRHIRAILIGALVTALLAGSAGSVLARDIPPQGQPGGPQVDRQSQELTITAIPSIDYDTEKLTATGGGTVTVHFVNNDTFKGGGILHNVAFYTDSSASTPLASGSVGAECTAPCSNDVTFALPAAGTYYFQCDVDAHAVTMSGEFNVLAGGDTPTPTAPPVGPTATSSGEVGAGTATPAGTVVAGVPSTGTGPGDSDSAPWWPLLLVVPLLAGGFAVFAVRHARR